MNPNRSAFTLVEVLIVVVLMAILAATIVPQFSTSTKDAQDSAAMFNLQGLRSQIEMYKAQHSGATPATLDKLLYRTNSSGTTGTDATNYPFGPYMPRMPDNPHNNQTGVDPISSVPPSGVARSTAGWLYHSTSGNVYLNDSASLTK